MKEIALIGIAQSLFFLVILILKKEKQLKDYFLSSFFLFIGAELLYRYLLYTDRFYINSRLVLFDIIYWALFGPVLLLYIRSVINKNLKLNTNHLFHLLPLIISLLSVLNYLLNTKSYNSFIEYYDTSHGITKIGLLIWEFTSAIYLLFALIILFKHKQKIKNYFSNIEKKELIWLLYLTIGFALFIYFSYVNWILHDIFNINTGIRSIGLLSTVLTVYVFVLGLFGYKQEGIFFELEMPDIEKKKLKPNEKKYQKTGLETEERNIINTRLIEYMQNEKPYLESEITINDLAIKLGTTVHKLSQVINEDHKRNFFDFINTYRVIEVKQLLSNSKIADLKIESIAYDCGFNSKSSFYSIFKKHTKYTPTEYRNKLYKTA